MAKDGNDVFRMSDQEVDDCGACSNRSVSGCQGNWVCERTRDEMLIIGEKLLPQVSEVHAGMKLLVGEPPPDLPHDRGRACNKWVQRLARAGNALVTLRNDASEGRLGFGAESVQS